MPLDIYQSLAQVLAVLPTDFAEHSVDKYQDDCGALLQRLWDLAEHHDDEHLRLNAGIPLAFWYEVQNRFAEGRQLWQAIMELQRRQVENQDDGLSLVFTSAVRYWREGHWKQTPDRFAWLVRILKEMGCKDLDLPVSTSSELNSFSLTVRENSELLDLAMPSVIDLSQSLADRKGKVLVSEFSVRVIAVAVTEKVAGLDHPCTAACLNYLARLLQDEEHHLCALPLCKRALTIRELALGPNHSLIAQSLNNIGLSLTCLGQTAEAEALLLRAVRVCPRMSNPHYWLARLYCQRDAHGDREKEAASWRRYLDLGSTLPQRGEEARTRLAELAD